MNLTKENINAAIQEILSSSYPAKYKKVANLRNSDMETTTSVFLTSVGLYVKVVFEDDSYGGNDRIESISIVEPVTQSVTNYE